MKIDRLVCAVLTLVSVSVSGDEYINKKAVEMGFAWYSKKYAPKDTDLADAMQKAKKEKTGLWKDDNPVPPWVFKKQEAADKTEKTEDIPSANNNGKGSSDGSAKTSH